MKILKHAAVAVAWAVSVAISSLMLILCIAWLSGSASLALSAMSVLGSGIIALMECRSPSTTTRLTDRRPLLHHPGLAGTAPRNVPASARREAQSAE
jgi:hypothetical protein